MKRLLPAWSACAGARDHGPLVRHLRSALPRPMVFVAGVFDLLHAGHVACLAWARGHGASLVVGVHGDLSARRLRKGSGPPLQEAAERARVVQALSAVSSVLVFDEDKPLSLLCALRPDVLVRGGCAGGSRKADLPDTAEAALLAEWGGVAREFPRVDGVSTAALLDRMAGRVLLPGSGRGLQRGFQAPALPAQQH